MCKKYIVLNRDGLHDYNIEVEPIKGGRKISISNSEGEHWRSQAQGKLQLSMKNNGNGIKFDRKLKGMDYHELLCLRILINFEHQTDKNEMNRFNYKIVEDKTILKL
jgi:hypothetical protein